MKLQALRREAEQRGLALRGAFTGAEYRVDRCAAYLAANPEAAYLTQGCATRRACPVGRAYRYEPAQVAFHMRAFLSAL